MTMPHREVLALEPAHREAARSREHFLLEEEFDQGALVSFHQGR